MSLLLNINLNFQDFKYFQSSNGILLFEVHSDHFIEYDIYEDFALSKSEDFFEYYNFQLQNGTITEISEDEWLIVNIR
jgi:hypothetical protein